MFSKDEEPRKKRVEKPKSKPGIAELITWVNDSFDKISEITTAAYLGVLNKKNMRGLAKSQSEELEPVEYMVPKGKLLAVQEGDFIRKGDLIIDGSPVPHDILNILGIEALISGRDEKNHGMYVNSTYKS